MSQETADYLVALADWHAEEVKRVTGPQAESANADPINRPPPPPPPPH